MSHRILNRNGQRTEEEPFGNRDQVRVNLWNATFQIAFGRSYPDDKVSIDELGRALSATEAARAALAAFDVEFPE